LKRILLTTNETISSPQQPPSVRALHSSRKLS